MIPFCSGRSQVTLDTTTAVTLSFLEGECIDDTLNSVIDCAEELYERPATPEIPALWLERGRWSLCARRSEMNDADDAESRMALA